MRRGGALPAEQPPEVLEPDLVDAADDLGGLIQIKQRHYLPAGLLVAYQGSVEPFCTLRQQSGRRMPSWRKTWRATVLECRTRSDAAVLESRVSALTPLAILWEPVLDGETVLPNRMWLKSRERPLWGKGGR